MATVEPTIRRWTRDEYHRVAELGLFRSERVELVDGEIVRRSPQGSKHIATTDRVAERLRAAFGEGYWVRMQFPLAIGESSEPEPDVAVVPGRREDYTDHPTGAVLVVEVSDTALDYDQNDKASLYARAGIEDYWIVNLKDHTLEVYREPAADSSARFGSQYTSRTILTHRETVSPLAAQLLIATDELSTPPGR